MEFLNYILVHFHPLLIIQISHNGQQYLHISNYVWHITPSYHTLNMKNISVIIMAHVLRILINWNSIVTTKNTIWLIICICAIIWIISLTYSINSTLFATDIINGKMIIVFMVARPFLHVTYYIKQLLSLFDYGKWYNQLSKLDSNLVLFR